MRLRPTTWAGVALLCVGGFPLLYALANDAWIYSGFGFADAHVNASLGRRFAEHAYRLEPYLDYKTSRVPLILFQAGVRAVLAPTAAQVLLALAPLLAIGALLWRIVGRALGPVSAALVTSLALGSSYLYVLRYTGGTDYMNLLGAAFALFAVERFGAALERGRARAWATFGAAFALALTTNPLAALVLAVLCGVELVASCRRLDGRALGRAAAAVAAGLVATTAGLAGACALAGKPANFLAPQLAQLAEAWRRRDQDLPDPAGLVELGSRPGYEHLGVAVAVLAASIAHAAWRLRPRARGRDVAGALRGRPLLYVAQFALVAAFFVWQEARGGILLDTVHHSHPLLVSLCLAVGGLWSLRGGGGDGAPGAGLAAWGAVAGGAVLGWLGPLASATAPGRGTLLAAGVTLAALGAGAALARRRARLALVLVGAGCGWATGALGEIVRYDPYGLNAAIHRADAELWEQLRAEGPEVTDHLYSYAGPGLVDVRLSPECHARRAALAGLADRLRGRDRAAVDPPLATSMSAARFANALHYSVGMRFLDRVGVRPDPAPYPPPPSTFVFYTPIGRLLVDSALQRERFLREEAVAVVVFGVTEPELRALAARLAAHGRPLVLRRTFEIRTTSFTLPVHLLSDAGV